ncbi:secreted protein [Melampsora americana]|nr:secreted protein [Melampsora americana]
MVCTLFLKSFVLSALASLAVAHNATNATADPMTGMGDASAVPANVSDYSGTAGTAVAPGTAPGVLSADGQCWCAAPPAAPAGNVTSDFAPPAAWAPTDNTTVVSPPAGLPPSTPAAPAAGTPNTTVVDDTTSGVAFLKGSSNACLLAAAAVVGITSLAA